MPYEEFKVIIGSDKENLVFYSTFFDDEVNAKFKKGEIYELHSNPRTTDLKTTCK